MQQSHSSLLLNFYLFLKLAKHLTICSGRSFQNTIRIYCHTIKHHCRSYQKPPVNFEEAWMHINLPTATDSEPKEWGQNSRGSLRGYLRSWSTGNKAKPHINYTLSGQPHTNSTVYHTEKLHQLTKAKPTHLQRNHPSFSWIKNCSLNVNYNNIMLRQLCKWLSKIRSVASTSSLSL